MNDSVLIVSDSWGIYVPQTWAERYGSAAVEFAKVSQEDVEIILSGPEHEHYWEAWECVLNDYDHNGYTLWQDGDLWELPPGYEFPED